MELHVKKKRKNVHGDNLTSNCAIFSQICIIKLYITVSDTNEIPHFYSCTKRVIFYRYSFSIYEAYYKQTFVCIRVTFDITMCSWTFIFLFMIYAFMIGSNWNFHSRFHCVLSLRLFAYFYQIHRKTRIYVNILQFFPRMLPTTYELNVKVI